MVSNTKILKRRRINRRKNAGKKRKTSMANKGTTPKFAIHVEENK